MSRCRHQYLALLPEKSQRLRCRRCHLTIDADELQGGYCPECYEAGGVRHNDFEVLATEQHTQYRCEQCGVVIDYRPLNQRSTDG